MASDPSHQDSESSVATQEDSGSPTAMTKKGRRQTAFYPNMANKPQKPFSRSAAKRESVMALGSIEYLQHYFTKTGIAPRKSVLKPNSNLVPAIGPGLIPTDIPHDPHVILPPSPMVPPPLRPTFPPFVKTYQTDPELLKPGVIEDLEAVEHAWGLDPNDPQSSRPQDPGLLGGHPRSSTSGNFDVLSVLKTTTRTIRSVRNYLVSLPDDFATPRATPIEFRPPSLSPRAERKVSQPDSPDDPLTLIRRSALDVLTVLRNLEETTRIPLSDDVYDVQSDGGSSSTRSHTPGGTERIASPFTTTSADDDDDSNVSFSFSVVKVPSQKKNSVLVWSDDEDDDEGEDTGEKKERWDERLVLAGGWLYKQDLSLDTLPNERDAVKRYLDAADKTLFGGRDQDGRRGWEKEKERLAAEKRKETKAGKGRRASAGDGEGQALPPQSSGRARRIVSAGVIDTMRDMIISEEPDDTLHSVTEEEEEEEEGEYGVDDDGLPDWAKRSKFLNDPLERLLSLLVALLPPDVLSLLPPSNNAERAALMYSLSSGQVLCIAYNIAVRKSRKPWGYINKTAIHDIATLEARTSEDPEIDKEKRKIGWTFRRTDNLRLWVAALKLRYMVPISPIKSQGSTPITSPSPSQQAFPSIEHMLLFDPQLIAKREEGWDTMLETAVLKWMWCVVGERRGST